MHTDATKGKFVVIFILNSHYEEIIIMDNTILISELKGKLDLLLTEMKEKKEKTAPRIYSTEDLAEYLRVGKGAIEKLRQNGELAYAKIGRTIVYTQQDVDILINNNHIAYV